MFSLKNVVGPQISKMADRSEMARYAIQSEFRTSKMTESSHFVQKNKVAYRSEMAKNASDLNNVPTDCWLTTTWYQYIYRAYIHTDSYVGNDGIYIVFAL